MKPKFCSCHAQDADACESPILGSPCPCACHKAERRPAPEVRAYLAEKLGPRVKFLPTDFSENPMGPAAFTIKDDRSEVVIEYEPGEGFGLTLVGWCEDEDRTYSIDSVVSKVTYWLDGYI